MRKPNKEEEENKEKPPHIEPILIDWDAPAPEQQVILVIISAY